METKSRISKAVHLAVYLLGILIWLGTHIAAIIIKHRIEDSMALFMLLVLGGLLIQWASTIWSFQYFSQVLGGGNKEGAKMITVGLCTVALGFGATSLGQIMTYLKFI